MIANAPKVSAVSGASAPPATIDIGEIIANVTKRFADRDRAAGAAVRIGRADTAKSKLNRDVGMRRAAEDLKASVGFTPRAPFFKNRMC